VPITRMNHAVFYARSAHRCARFYEDVLGFTEVIHDDENRWSFLRAPASDNHHDVVFFTVGDLPPAEAGRRTTGLYHIAWEVPTLGELDAMRSKLEAAGALQGSSDHGPNKSLYARDPDGNEFEVMWLTPRASWGAEEHEAIVRRLDLPAELARFGADTVGRTA
jgi:catechol-2,3-dioxygenase